MSQESVLSPVLTFGWKADVVGNGAFLPSNQVAYVANKLLVIHDEQNHSQTIAECNPNGIATAMAVSPNRKLIAVAQYAYQEMPFIELFTWPLTKTTITLRTDFDPQISSVFLIISASSLSFLSISLGLLC